MYWEFIVQLRTIRTLRVSSKKFQSIFKDNLNLFGPLSDLTLFYLIPLSVMLSLFY